MAAYSYNLEYGGAKTNAMAALAKQLIADSIPLDGIGFQAHLIVGSTPSATNLATQLSLFTSLGLDVAVSGHVLHTWLSVERW